MSTSPTFPTFPAVRTYAVSPLGMLVVLRDVDPFQTAAPIQAHGFLRWLSAKQPQQTARFEVWCDDMEDAALGSVMCTPVATACLEASRANWAR